MITLTVDHVAGLHARPASMFVQTASRYKSDVFVSSGKRTVNAKNIIGILSLGIKQGATIDVSAVGADAVEALTAIKLLVKSNFAADENPSISINREVS